MLTSFPGQKSGSIKLAKKDAKEAKPAAAKKEKVEPKAEKAAAPKAKKAATTTVSLSRHDGIRKLEKLPGY